MNPNATPEPSNPLAVTQATSRIHRDGSHRGRDAEPTPDPTKAQTARAETSRPAQAPPVGPYLHDERRYGRNTYTGSVGESNATLKASVRRSSRPNGRVEVVL